VNDEMQTTIFGDEQPMSQVPHLNCTKKADCPAPADAHDPDCPVEQKLREIYGF
jgi:hypothetical protein